MDINSIPEVFESRVRLAIVSSLLHEEKSFNELKEITKATDGNLSVQLTKLETLGYITSKKEFVGKKPRTTYVITDTGKLSFKTYVEMLEKILNDPKIT